MFKICIWTNIFTGLWFCKGDTWQTREKETGLCTFLKWSQTAIFYINFHKNMIGLPLSPSKPWHTPDSQKTRTIPSTAVSHTSAGQEFRGQACFHWRACSYWRGRCGSELGPRSKGTKQRGGDALFAYQMRPAVCVGRVYRCAHARAVSEKRRIDFLGNVPDRFWHWSFPLETWASAERAGGGEGSNTSSHHRW